MKTPVDHTGLPTEPGIPDRRVEDRCYFCGKIKPLSRMEKRKILGGLSVVRACSQKHLSDCN